MTKIQRVVPLVGVSLLSLCLGLCQTGTGSQKSTSAIPTRTLGETLISQEKYQEAIDYYQKALAQDRGDIVGHYNLAALSYDARNYEQALRHVDAAIRLRREFPLAWFLKGEILARSKLESQEEENPDTGQALECFENALNLPDYSLPPSRTMKLIAWSWKATLIRETDKANSRFEEVMDCLAQAAAMAGDYEAAILLSKRGVLQFSYQRYGECLRTLQNAISRFSAVATEKASFSSEIAALHNLRGLSYYRQKQFERALEEYDEAIRLLEPLDGRMDMLFLQGVYSNKGLLYESSGQHQEALGLFRRLDVLAKLRDLGYLHHVPLNAAVALFRAGDKEAAFEKGSGYQTTYEGLQYIFQNAKIYVAYRGAPELTGTFFLSSPVDIGDPRVPGKRPIELRSAVYLAPVPLVTQLDDLVIPSTPVTLPARAGSMIVAERSQTPESSSAGSVYRKTYAYVIGIGDYEHVTKLPNPVSDARKIYELLKTHYNFDKVELILDHEATKARIEAIFDEELSKTGDEDGVFIFYAGHGYSVPSPWTGQLMGYLVPVAGWADPERISGSCISMEELKSKVQSVVRARHVLLVLDCCYSGLINRGLADTTTRRIMPEGPQMFRKEIQDFSRKRVFQYVTAGDRDEEVPDVSVFMKYLLEALSPTEGVPHLSGLAEFTSRELYAYLLEPVLTATRKQPQKGNLIGNGEFIFSLKRSN